MRIADIKVGKRRREEMGDIEGLAASIRRYGLIHPVVVDQDWNLVAGSRRLAALNQLKRRVYKQEALFDISDYRQAVEYHVRRAKRHRMEAEALRDRCVQRHLVQLALPWAANE